MAGDPDDGGGESAAEPIAPQRSSSSAIGTQPYIRDVSILRIELGKAKREAERHRERSADLARQNRELKVSVRRLEAAAGEVGRATSSQLARATSEIEELVKANQALQAELERATFERNSLLSKQGKMTVEVEGGAGGGGEKADGSDDSSGSRPAAGAGRLLSSLRSSFRMQAQAEPVQTTPEDLLWDDDLPQVPSNEHSGHGDELAWDYGMPTMS